MVNASLSWPQKDNVFREVRQKITWATFKKAQGVIFFWHFLFEAEWRESPLTTESLFEKNEREREEKKTQVNIKREGSHIILKEIRVVRRSGPIAQAVTFCNQQAKRIRQGSFHRNDGVPAKNAKEDKWPRPLRIFFFSIS